MWITIGELNLGRVKTKAILIIYKCALTRLAIINKTKCLYNFFHINVIPYSATE